MKARERSLSGFLLGIVLIPVLAGLVACIEIMPVPVGDPEKSRVDPALTGLWLDDRGAFDGAVWVFEPYDKRTWLLALYSISDDDCQDVVDPAEANSGDVDETGSEAPADEEIVEAPLDEERVEAATDEEVIAAPVDETEVQATIDEEVIDAPLEEEIIEVVVEDDYASLLEELRAQGTNCLSGELVLLVKAWLTKIGSGEFLTWEPKAEFDEDTGFVPQEWIVFRMIREGRNTLRFRMIDAEFEGFDARKVQAKLDRLERAGTGDENALDSARRAVERVIRRNIDDDDLYFEEDFSVIQKVQPNDYEIFVGIVVAGSE